MFLAFITSQNLIKPESLEEGLLGWLMGWKRNGRKDGYFKIRKKKEDK